jgi:hypothetical protein
MRTRNKIAMGAAAVALLTTSLALAAPSRETTLSPGGPGFGWEGGPLSGAALFAEVNAVLPCGPAKGCDDTLIKAPERGQLVVEMDSAAVDLDLYVFESDAEGTPGKMLKSSTSGSSAEKVTVNVPGGIYLVRVVTAAAAEDTYTATASQAVLPPVDLDDKPPDFGPDPAPGDGTGNGGGGGGGGQGGSNQPGTQSTPPTTNAAPTSYVRRPGRTSKRLVGTASDPDGTVQYVDVGLVRVLRGGKRCLGLTPHGGFRKIRKCTDPAFLRASGRTRWTMRMKRPLRPGRYVLYSRAVDNIGLPEAGFGSTNRMQFRVTR